MEYKIHQRIFPIDLDFVESFLLPSTLDPFFLEIHNNLPSVTLLDFSSFKEGLSVSTSLVQNTEGGAIGMQLRTEYKNLKWKINKPNKNVVNARMYGNHMGQRM